MECDEILDLIKREMSDDITEVIGFRDKTTIFIEKLKDVFAYCRFAYGNLGDRCRR